MLWWDDLQNPLHRFASWKSVTPSASTCDDLIDFSDFLPTLAELSETELPSDRMIDGRSFAPQLRGNPGNPREWVYVQFEQKWFVRDKHWKLHQDGRFFDMQRDPFELGKPVATENQNDEMRDARRRLQSVLHKLNTP